MYRIYLLLSCLLCVIHGQKFEKTSYLENLNTRQIGDIVTASRFNGHHSPMHLPRSLNSLRALAALLLPQSSAALMKSFSHKVRFRADGHDGHGTCRQHMVWNTKSLRAPVVQMSGCPFAEATQLWLRDVIIEHNLCPWARPTLQNGNLRIVTSPVTALDDDQLEQTLKSEAKALIEAGMERMATTIVVLPYASCSFPEFQAYCKLADSSVIGQQLSIAMFHPNFEIGDAKLEDFNLHFLSHRSPYPVIHLLRRCDVSQVDYEISEKVRKDNYRTIEGLGSEEIERLTLQCVRDTVGLTNEERLRLEKITDDQRLAPKADPEESSWIEELYRIKAET